MSRAPHDRAQAAVASADATSILCAVRRNAVRGLATAQHHSIFRFSPGCTWEYLILRVLPLMAKSGLVTGAAIEDGLPPTKLIF